MTSRLNKLFTAVDSHTEGEPTRVITEGLGEVPGETMLEKQKLMERNLDQIRRLAVLEPRGHSAMVAAVLLPPANPLADLGVVYLDETGYLPMCGHGTIGICTVALETGILPADEPRTHLKVDTPAGLVEATALVRDGKVRSVSIRNVPSFLHSRDVEIVTPTLGKLSLDVAWGGNFFAILPAETVGLRLEKDHARRIAAVAKEIMDAIAEQIQVRHPDEPEINEVKHVMFTGPADVPGADGKNATVIYPGNLDRSPCGTGTSARMAQMCARGEFQLDREFVHESLLKTTFKGRLVGRTTLLSGTEAVVPEIEGRAWITGFQRFVLDPDDPFQLGFALDS